MFEKNRIVNHFDTIITATIIDITISTNLIGITSEDYKSITSVIRWDFMAIVTDVIIIVVATSVVIIAIASLAIEIVVEFVDKVIMIIMTIIVIVVVGIIDKTSNKHSFNSSTITFTKEQLQDINYQ